MTQLDFDTFVQTLLDLNGSTPAWYWDMLDLAKGKLTAENLKFTLKIMSSGNKKDTEMGQKLAYFYEHKTDSDVKIYLNTVRLLLPILVNPSQFNDHKEFNADRYYRNIIEFVSYMGDPKLQYDVLTRVIDKLSDKVRQDKTEINSAYAGYRLTYSVARALRSVNDYAQNPARFTKRNLNDKMFEYEMEHATVRVRETRMQDLYYYMQIADKMADSRGTKFDVASEIVRVGWEKLGEIAKIPHAHFGPDNMLGKDIAEIGNLVRSYVAAAGNTPEINELLDKVVWPKFATKQLRQQILDGTFNPNEIPMLVAEQQKRFNTK